MNTEGNRVNKRLLNVKEVATYLGLSSQTISNGISRNARTPFPIKPKRVGKLVRFDIRDLDKWVDSLDTQSSECGN
jgi:excisionase family DNA binding protein